MHTDGKSIAGDTPVTGAGVLYVATGKRYVNEAMRSARTVRHHMPGIPIALFTDAETPLPEGLFDRLSIIEAPYHSTADKIRCMSATPFERTLFLDTDTRITQPVGDLFEILDRFDLACSHGPWRTCGIEVPGCPEAFPELNTGVVAYRSVPEVIAVFRRWGELHREMRDALNRRIHDQPAFRRAVYESRLQLYVLPPEYNLRTPFPWFAGGNAQVKILHGRGPTLHRARQMVNRGRQPRIGDARKPKRPQRNE